MRANGDNVAGLQTVGRDVNTLAIDQDVTMVDELGGLATTACKVQAIHYVVKSALKQRNEVFTGLTRDSDSFVKSKLELFLKHAIGSLQLLLLAKLKTIVCRFLGTGPRVLSRKSG
jgi:nucleoside-triphosphatase THEP1